MGGGGEVGRSRSFKLVFDLRQSFLSVWVEFCPLLTFVDVMDLILILSHSVSIQRERNSFRCFRKENLPHPFQKQQLKNININLYS